MRVWSWSRLLLLSAVLVGAQAACADSTEEEGSASEAITADQAATELSKIASTPENTLSGIGEAVHEVTDAGGTWTFYPYRSPVTREVAEDSESIVIVVGSRNELFLVDLASGGGAGAMPANVDFDDASRRLEAALAKSSTTTNAIEPQGVPGVSAVTRFFGDVVARVVGGFTRNAVVRRISAPIGKQVSTLVTYYSKSVITNVGETGPAKVASTLGKIAETSAGKAEIRSIAGTATTARILTRDTARLTSILKGKTKAPIATTTQAGVKLLESKPNTTWIVANDNVAAANDNIVTSIVKSGALKPDANVVLPAGISAEAAAQLRAAGKPVLRIVGGKDMDALAAGRGPLATTLKDGDAVIVAASEAEARSFFHSAKNYIVGWVDTTKMAAADLMKTPFFAAINGIALRIKAGLPLPKLTVVGAEGKIIETEMGRALRILTDMGIKVSGAAVAGQIEGLLVPATPPQEGDAGTETTLPGTTVPDAPETTAPAEELPAAEALSEETPLDPAFKRKSKDDGCSASPNGSGGASAFGGLALALAGVAASRRRRRD